MSDRSSAYGDAWRPWQMGMLERRTNHRAPTPQDTAVPARRREDEINFTLFELAKEEAVSKGRSEGYAEGFEQGYAEGEARVRAEQQDRLAAEIETQVAPIRELSDTFRQAVDGLNDQVSYALVELALETGRQLAGRALELKPEHILDDIEELLADNPDISGTPTLYVNIDDMALVEAPLANALTAAGWSLRPDMHLARGDCRVETTRHAIDATGSDRWTRLLHTVGHGEH